MLEYLTDIMDTVNNPLISIQMCSNFRRNRACPNYPSVVLIIRQMGIYSNYSSGGRFITAWKNFSSSFSTFILSMTLRIYSPLLLTPKTTPPMASFFLKKDNIIGNFSDSETDDVINLTRPEPPSKKKHTDYIKPARIPDSANQIPYFSFAIIVCPFALMFCQLQPALPNSSK